MKINKLLGISFSSLAIAGSASAALMITDPNFSSGDPGSVAPSGGGTYLSEVGSWMESNAYTYADGTFTKAFADTTGIPVDDPRGFIATGGYLYQSLGTLDSASTSITIAGDRFQRGSEAAAANLNVTLYFGNPGAFVASNGSDVSGSVSLTALNATSTTNTGASGNLGAGASQAFSVTFDATSISASQEVWVRITNDGGAATALVDNLTIDVVPVPEPSSTALLGLSGLAFILRRRK